MAKKIPIIIIFILSLYILLSSGCNVDVLGGGGTDVPGGGDPNEEYYSVTVSWDKNVESLVNSPGGGYKVYYSENPGFSIDDPDVSDKDVPLDTGGFAPTSTTLLLTAGTWYIKIVAYFSLNEGASSLPSGQRSVTLP